MALWLHVHGGYPSYQAAGEDWKQADWDAFNLVKALKGHPFKGYATLQTKNGHWVTFRATDRGPAYRIFGEWAAAKLGEIGLTQAVLVPVPSSTCLAVGTDAKGRALADAIAQRANGFSVADALHWKKDLGKAAEGGSRDPAILQANLVVQAAAASTIVLVDDVATSGGHLLACARALRASGHTVEHALCAAQTVNTHPANMWAIESHDLEANAFESLALDF